MAWRTERFETSLRASHVHTLDALRAATVLTYTRFAKCFCVTVASAFESRRVRLCAGFWLAFCTSQLQSRAHLTWRLLRDSGKDGNFESYPQLLYAWLQVAWYA